MPFQKGHKKHGGIEKGTKHVDSVDKNLKADVFWVYKELGGRTALLGWAQNPKGSNPKFWEMLSKVVGTTGKIESKDKRKVFFDDTVD